MPLFPRFGTEPPAKVATVAKVGSLITRGQPDCRRFRNFRGPAGLEFQQRAVSDDHIAQCVADFADACDPWDATDWRAYYDERAGIVEFDGGYSRAEAEVRAWECCIAEWLNLNPVHSEPGRCLACSESGALGAPVPYGTENAGHDWLHGRCWPSWYEARKAEATAALVVMGLRVARKAD